MSNTGVKLYCPVGIIPGENSEEHITYTPKTLPV